MRCIAELEISRRPHSAQDDFLMRTQQEIVLLFCVLCGRLRNWNRRKKMKRTFALLAAGILTFGCACALSGCGSSGDASSEDKDGNGYVEKWWLDSVRPESAG